MSKLKVLKTHVNTLTDLNLKLATSVAKVRAKYLDHEEWIAALEGERADTSRSCLTTAHPHEKADTSP